MKNKYLIGIFITIMCLMLVGCKNNNEKLNNTNDNTNQIKENTNNKNNNTNNQNISNNTIVVDDEDNKEVTNAKTTVKEVVNCPGCVYAYFSDEGDKAKTLGSSLSSSEYTDDVNNLKTAGGKQRHNFFGLVLSGGKISKAYACILKDDKIYCIQGSTGGEYFESNIAILNKIFTSNQCKTISNGHTYTCTDSAYNGDTQTSGYTSMHYETSCTIYGKDANTGKLICH